MPLVRLTGKQIDDLLALELPENLRSALARERFNYASPERQKAERELLEWVDKHRDRFDDGDLDDLVHEVCAGIAASINNEGLDAQVRFLLEDGIHPSQIRAYLHREGLDDDEEADDEIVVEGEE